MKPTNLKTENCESKSSNCVIWDGPKITFGNTNICKGDSITPLIYAMAQEILTLRDIVNVTNYTTVFIEGESVNSCFQQEITNFKELIQALITKVCNS